MVNESVAHSEFLLQSVVMIKWDIQWRVNVENSRAARSAGRMRYCAYDIYDIVDIVMMGRGVV